MLHRNLVFVSRLLDVLMQESRLYLIFEFLSMDLKKYLDSIPSGQFMDPMLVKVSAFFHPMLPHSTRVVRPMFYIVSSWSSVKPPPAINWRGGRLN